MKIKIGDGTYVEISTLVKLEWRKYYPVLVVHERFEKRIKWILRIIAFISISISIISFSRWFYSLGVTLLIFLLEQFFERTLFEYTTIIFHPFPDFEIDPTQWVTNSFMIPVSHKEDPVIVGPAFRNKEYAINFFLYLNSWIGKTNIDKNNEIALSFVIEPNEQYSTYIYSNTEKQDIDPLFERVAESNKLLKYGKRQQKFVEQKVFWHTFPFKEGSFIKKFLDFQKQDGSFLFMPSVIAQNGKAHEFLWDCQIHKYHYKVRQREELTKQDIEYLFSP